MSVSTLRLDVLANHPRAPTCSWIENQHQWNTQTSTSLVHDIRLPVNVEDSGCWRLAPDQSMSHEKRQAPEVSSYRYNEQGEELRAV